MATAGQPRSISKARFDLENTDFSKHVSPICCAGTVVRCNREEQVQLMLEHLPNFPQINGTLIFVVLKRKPREARWAWELRGSAEGRGLTVSRCSQGADAEDPADQHQSPTKHQGPGGGGQGEDPEGAAPAWPRGWGRALGGGNPSVLVSSDLLQGSQGALVSSRGCCIQACS